MIIKKIAVGELTSSRVGLSANCSVSVVYTSKMAEACNYGSLNGRVSSTDELRDI